MNMFGVKYLLRFVSCSIALLRDRNLEMAEFRYVGVTHKLVIWYDLIIT